MAAPDALYELVECFERNADAYRSGRYKETQVRLEFIDPFFELLGKNFPSNLDNVRATKEVINV